MTWCNALLPELSNCNQVSHTTAACTQATLNYNPDSSAQQPSLTVPVAAIHPNYTQVGPHAFLPHTTRCLFSSLNLQQQDSGSCSSQGHKSGHGLSGSALGLGCGGSSEGRGSSVCWGSPGGVGGLGLSQDLLQDNKWGQGITENAGKTVSTDY
jgi:hypothetical protein